MKKTIVLIAILGLCSLSQINSQISKGRFLVGVSSAAGLTASTGIGSELLGIGITTIKSNEENPYDMKMTSINVMPKAGYFILDNLAIGIDGCLFSSIVKSEDKYSSTGTAIGPFARYYFTSGNVIPVVEAGGMLGSIKSKSNYGTYNNDSKQGFNSLWGAAGFSVRLGNKAALDLLAGYNKFTMHNDSDESDAAKGTMGTLSFKAGFQILLGSDKNQ